MSDINDSKGVTRSAIAEVSDGLEFSLLGLHLGSSVQVSFSYVACL